jgi:transforming growth factor-beta-induced protein
MKILNQKKLGLLIVLTVFLLAACSSSNHPPASQEPTLDIVETAIEDGRFTTLVAALEAAGLVDALSGPGPFTVFAPTDDAFDLLPEGTVEFLLENIDVLSDILTYHVIDGEVSAADARGLDGTSAVMLNGLNMRIDVDNGAIVLNLNGNREAMVIDADIAATNGVIHVIDAVLDPADEPLSIVETAIADGRFTTLVTALEAADLVEALSGPGPFTVFAPTDDAFNKLPAGTIDFLLDPANKGVLTEILTYHVFDGSVLASVAVSLDGETVEMLNGANLALDVIGDELVLNAGGNRPAVVIITDVLASNGVIHVIDTVLDPDDAN